MNQQTADEPKGDLAFKYEVLVDNHTHRGLPAPQGSVIELTEAQAAPLVERKKVKAAKGA